MKKGTPREEFEKLFMNLPLDSPSNPGQRNRRPSGSTDPTLAKF
jgi:hypothetical protein